MYIGIVCAALLGLADDLLPSQKDLSFVCAVEDFVQKSCDPLVKRDIVKQYNKLGSSKYKEREEESKRLLEYYYKNPYEARWLFWGRRSRDKEIALRCNTLIRQLNKCFDCNGSGRDKRWEETPCSECRGHKTLWGLTAWD